MPIAVSPERESVPAVSKGSVSPRSNSVEDFPTLVVDSSALDIASRILAIINNYRLQRSSNDPAKADQGASNFLAVIYSHAIQDIYPPGAKLTIISDGLVYNDLLGVPDKDVWNYGHGLRRLALAKGFSRIEFSRLRDLVCLSLPAELDEMTYVANASNFRRALLNTFGKPNWEWEEVSRIEDVRLTYRGYIKFLQTDLADVYPVGDGRTKTKYKRGIEYIAKQMMARGDAFASAVRQKYKHCIRLSIHPSTGANKISVGLLPTTTMYTTPWHCTIAYKLDGTVVSGMRSEFDNDSSYELVLENGAPSYFREKSHLFTWGAEKGGVAFEPIYPSGWMLRPSRGPGSMSIHDIDANKVRSLAEINSPIVMRGFFESPKQHVFVEKAKEFGEPLSWKFGLVLEVKDQGSDTRGLNNVLSSEWMPFHYDGLFKTVTKVNEKGEVIRVSDPPQFQFFAGATSSPKDTGFTLFSSSTMLFKYLPKWVSADELSTKTWTVSTSSFNSTVLNGLPLIARHPTTGKSCLRYHESWPQSKTKFEATSVTIDDTDETTGRVICEAIDATLHDRRVAYYHTWEKGDLVVSDNILMMHTRSDFDSRSDRELWRIHFD